MSIDDVRVSKANKFMTGSDIEGLMTFATNSEIDALFN